MQFYGQFCRMFKNKLMPHTFLLNSKDFLDFSRFLYISSVLLGTVTLFAMAVSLPGFNLGETTTHCMLSL